MRLFLSLFLVIGIGFPLISSAKIHKRPTLIRLTAEEIDLPAGEKMGLLGSSYLVRLNRYVYTGFGVYSAVTGQRGGFFTGGLDTGIKFGLGKKLELDASLFVGGGGGGSAPQGGGLMLRPQIGLMYKTAIGKIGFQVSQVRFPNGDISSNQLALTYEQPLSMILSSNWLSGARTGHLSNKYRPAEQDFSVLAQRYRLPAGTRNTNNNIQDKTMSLIGVEWDTLFGKHGFVRLQTLGSLGGNSDGYASVLMGLGYRYSVTPQTEFKLAASLGASGGGRVDTGGGFTESVSLNVQHRFGNGLLLGAKAGYLNAPGGDFSATSYALYLGKSDRAPVGKTVGTSHLKPRHWRLRIAHQTYLTTGDTRRKSQTLPDDRNVDLFGLQTDIFFDKNYYLTGQALGAYDGGAGGYASGLIGAGLTRPLWKNSRMFINAEVLVGAAGGGGLAVGDGLVGQMMVGVGYRTSRSTSLILSYGKIKSKGGNFEADVVNLNFGYRYTTLTW